MLQPLKVEDRAIPELTANPANSRTHTSKQIRQIATSIERFGFNNPVLVDEDGRIVAGHGRVEAAKLLGMWLGSSECFHGDLRPGNIVSGC